MTAEEQLQKVREILGVHAHEDLIHFLENSRVECGLSNWEPLRQAHETHLEVTEGVRQEHYNTGYDEGVEAGRIEGYDSGHADGRKEAKKEMKALFSTDFFKKMERNLRGVAKAIVKAKGEVKEI